MVDHESKTASKLACGITFYKKAKNRRKHHLNSPHYLFAEVLNWDRDFQEINPLNWRGFIIFTHVYKEYINSLSSEKKDAVKKIISVIQRKLPKGFNEQMNYGMPSWVVPHSTYPKGYHCSPELPLPFLSLASRKNYIALYHM